VEVVIVIVVAVVAILVLLMIAARLERITIFEYQRGLRFTGGKGPDLVEPGQYWVFRPRTVILPIDMREQFTSLTGQELITSDSVSVKLSVLVRYRMADPKLANVEVADHYGAMYSLVQIALREAVATRTIDDVLERRDEIGPDVVARCAEKIHSIGLELISVDVRDLMFPGPLKKTFAQVIEARQQGLAALEKARGETAALRALANAARMVESNPSLLQLRLVQQLESSRGHTVVLGFPSNSTPLPVRSEGEAPAELDTGQADRNE